MSYMPKAHNGIRRRRVSRARYRILKEAKKKGFVTNARAKEIGKFEQAWFHLNAMAKAGLLKKTGFNIWEPKKRKGKRGRMKLDPHTGVPLGL